MSDPDSKEDLEQQVGDLSLAYAAEDESDRTIEILQHLENFFSTPQFTGNLTDFVQSNMEKFVFVASGEEQPLRYIYIL
jgi:hypothetical protein